MIIDSNEKAQFLGIIIDIFEDFLEAHDVKISNPEKCEEPDNPAIIFGKDYDALAGDLEGFLAGYGIL